MPFGTVAAIFYSRLIQSGCTDELLLGVYNLVPVCRVASLVSKQTTGFCVI